MTAEEERTRLIGDIARVLRDGPVPDDARAAALTFIGWLARRMPGEPVSVCDLTLCRGYARVADGIARTGGADGIAHTNGIAADGIGRADGARPSSSGSRRQSRPPRSVR